MASVSGIFKLIAGAAAIAAGVLIEVGTLGGGTPLASLLISAGAGEFISGLGTLIAGNRQTNPATASRNPVKSWDICEGQCRVGGDLVYLNTWPAATPQNPSPEYLNQYLDMVVVIAATQIKSVDAVLFDQKPIAIDPTAVPYPPGGGPGNPWPTLGGTSYTPTQTNKQLNSGVSGDSTVVRANGVVTVTIANFDIPALGVGDSVILQDENGGTALTQAKLNGTFIVQQIIKRVQNVSLTFTVLNGGLNVTVTNAGWVTTTWVDYGRNVYVEYMLGNQILGQTFNGLVAGTPYQGTGLLIGPNLLTFSNPPGSQPWTNYCSLQGKAAVFIRLSYNSKYFSAGLPQISFVIHGNNFVYDPRLGGLTGIGRVTLYTAGGGGYAAGDVLTVAGGTGGKVTITTVDGSGNPLSWMVTATGYGYSLGVQPASGGYGSGAEFDITVLCGISSGVSGASIPFGGVGYSVGDVLQLDSGSMGAVRVTSIGSGGAVSGVSVVYAGYGYNTGVTTTNNNNGGSRGGYGCKINVTALTGSGSSAVYTQNSALIIADFQANTIWGYSAQYVFESSTPIPYNNIGITALTVAANVCDQPIPLAEGGNEPMYETHGKFDLSARRGDILQNLLSSCAGRFVYVGGLYTIQPGYWVGTGSPPVQVNLTAIASGAFKWKPNVSVRDLYNGVKGTYISPANNWQPSDVPYYAQDFLHGYGGPSQYGGDINLAVDLGQRRWLDVHLPFTISPSMAQRIFKIELLRRRNQGAYGIGTGTFPLNMAGYQFVPLDVFEADVAFFGWTNKILEVSSVRFRSEKQSKDGSGDVVVIGTELDVRETNAGTYAWSISEELSPQGYQQALPPVALVKESVCFPWSPGAVAPLNGDAIYLAGTSGPGNFAVLPIYGLLTGGVGTANIQVSGQPPINQLNTTIGAPEVYATVSATGGSLGPGTYAVGVSAFDGSGTYKNTPYLDFATVTVPGGAGVAGASISNGGSNYRLGDIVSLQGGSNTAFIVVTGISGASTGAITSLSVGNPGYGYSTGTVGGIGGSGTGASITITSLTSATSTGSIVLTVNWGAGDEGGDIYMAMPSINPAQYALLVNTGQLLAQDVMHYQSTLSSGSVQTVSTITSFNASTAGGPDTLFDHFGIVWQPILHGGPWAEQVQAVTGTSGSSPGTITIACESVSSPGMTVNQWAGYTLSLWAHYDPAVPVQILNMPIVSSTASVLVGSVPEFTLTIGQNAAGGQLPDLTTLLNIADLVVIRSLFTFTASSMSDPNIANDYYPTGAVGVEAGHLAVVMSGADTGDVQVISSVTTDIHGHYTVFNIQGTWQVTPATGDIVIICAPASPEVKTNSFSTPNKTGGVVTVGIPNILNLLGQAWLFTVKTEDVHGNSAPLFVAPKREIYIAGAQGTRLIQYVAGSPPTSTYTMLSYDGLIEADCTGGDLVYNLLQFSTVPNIEITVVKIDSGSNTITVNCYSGDTFADGSTSWVGAAQGNSLTFKVNA